MKSLYYIFVLLLVSCGNNEVRKKPELFKNADSIAFTSIKNSEEYLDFSEFIVKFPESVYLNEALDRYHSERDKFYSIEEMPIIDCFRNCAPIKIKTSQKIEYQHDPIELINIKDSLLCFFCNINYSERYSQQGIIEDFYGQENTLSKGHIQLEYVKDSCSVLPLVLLEISDAIKSYKNYVSIQWYSKKFDELTEEEQNHLNSLLYSRLILYGLYKEYAFMPPAPPLIEFLDKIQ